MNIRAANAPVSWGIMEVEGWGPQLSYTDFLDELVSAGYRGTELGPYGFMSTAPDELGRELERRDVSLLSAFVPLRLKEEGLDLEPAREVGRLLGALDATHLVVADALWDEREAVSGRVEESGVALSDDDWKRVAANIAEVGEVASEFGLRCVFHHHAGSYIETPAEVERLLDTTPI
ncbi:MAG: TIM barrel protein, partial [bacterium]|nr:TIM barrel protein [bacterium]